MHIVVAGHVDHGKSTVIGRLLVDTNSLPDGKLEAVRALCERTARPFEYAFLLDALKDEQAQGITIDTARIFFKSAVRDYVILDAPGHVEFLKNMVTGASRAEAALLVIDAREGVQENSRRHGYLLGMLGIRQIAVLLNKMDMVDYSRARFDHVRADYTRFLTEVGLQPMSFIPVAARSGCNLAERSERLPWYDGPTVLQALDAFTPDAPESDKPFRMPVQDVYKFTQDDDDRRIIAGTVETGHVHIGDEIVFLPSGKTSRVRSIEAFNAPPQMSVGAGAATGLTLQDQIYVTRGEVACLTGERLPAPTSRLRASVFWMGKQPLVQAKQYLLKIGTARLSMRVEEIHFVLDASTLAGARARTSVDRHEVAECTLELGRAVAADLAEQLPATGRFVIVDDYEICGGGIVRELLRDQQASARERVLLRDLKWESGSVPRQRRAARFGQQPALLLVTGPRATDRKRIAKELEASLFDEGRLVYFLGIGNVLYGVDADLERDTTSRTEHVRRLAEVANILLDAGMILIATAAELTADDVDLIRTCVAPDPVTTAWIGERTTANVDADLWLDDSTDATEATVRLRRLLHDVDALGHV